MKVTIFPAVNQTIGDVHEVADVAELAEIIKSPTAATKGDLPLIKLATFAENRRRNENLAEVWGVEGDYDAGEISAREAAEILRVYDVDAVVYTTPSNTGAPGGHRWRVLCPLATPVSAGERAGLVAYLNGLLGAVLASESFVDSQPFFIGVAADAVAEIDVMPLEGSETIADIAAAPPPGVAPVYPPGVCPSRPGGGAKRGTGRIAHAPEQVDLYRRPAVQLPAEKIARMLERVDNSVVRADIGWDAWNAVGMAVFNATGGSPEGRAVFEEWSARHPRYDAGEVAERWGHWRVSPGDHLDGANLENRVTRLVLANPKRGPGAGAGPETGPGPGPRPEAEPESEAEPEGSAKADRDNARDFRPLSAFSGSPPRDFVEDTLIDASLAAIFGVSNSGKTFLALDLARAIAAGDKWLGLDCDQGLVGYVAGEGGGGMRKRIDAMRRSGVDTNIPLEIMPLALDLRTLDGDLKWLIERIRALEERHGQKMRVLFLDTLNRMLAGGDENSAHDMGIFRQSVDTIRERIGCAVVVLHHSGKDEDRGQRGHSSWLGAIDTEIRVKKTGDGLGVVSVTKARDLEMWGDRGFRLKRVDLDIDTRGKIVSSCVVQYIEMAPGASKNAPSGTYEILLMRIIHNLFADSARRVRPQTWRKSGGPVAVADVVGRDEVQEFFAAEPEMAGRADGTVQRGFRRAIEECVRKGLLLAHKNELALPNDGGGGGFYG